MTDLDRWLLAAAGAGFIAGALLLAWWAGAHDIPGAIRRWVVRRVRRGSSGFPST